MLVRHGAAFRWLFEVVVEEDEEVSRGLDWTGGGDLQRRSCRVSMKVL